MDYSSVDVKKSFKHSVFQSKMLHEIEKNIKHTPSINAARRKKKYSFFKWKNALKDDNWQVLLKSQNDTYVVNVIFALFMVGQPKSK